MRKKKDEVKENQPISSKKNDGQHKPVEDFNRLTKIEMEQRLIQDERINKIEGSLSRVSDTLSKFELTQTKLSDHMVEIDKRFENIYRKFDQIRADIKDTNLEIDKSFEKVEKRLFDTEERSNGKFQILDTKLDTMLGRAMQMALFFGGTIIGVYVLLLNIKKFI